MNMTTVPNNQIKAMRQEIASLKEQVAQLRIEADFNFEQYQDAGRLLCDLQEITEQQAEAIRLKDDALELESDAIKDLMEWCVKNIAKWHFPQYDDLSYAIKKKEKALAIQPSPEILQARDERVAEACAKVLDARWDDVAAIETRSGEWKEYL